MSQKGKRGTINMVNRRFRRFAERAHRHLVRGAVPDKTPHYTPFRGRKHRIKQEAIKSGHNHMHSINEKWHAAVYVFVLAFFVLSVFSFFKYGSEGVTGFTVFGGAGADGTADSGSLEGSYDKVDGSFTSTQADDNNYYAVEENKGNAGTVLVGNMTLIFELSKVALNSSNKITGINGNLVYCHGKKNNDGCAGNSAFEGNANQMNIFILDTVSNNYVDVGDVSATAANTEASASWQASGNMSNYFDANGKVTVKFEFNINSGGNGQKSAFLVELATITVDYDVVDNVAPVVSNIAVSGITNQSASVSWSTDESADSAVNYGISVSLGSSVADNAKVTSHVVQLSNLAQNTTYYYNVKSCDASSNCANNSIATFVTSATVSSSSSVANTTNTSTTNTNTTNSSTTDTNTTNTTSAASNSTNTTSNDINSTAADNSTNQTTASSETTSTASSSSSGGGGGGGGRRKARVDTSASSVKGDLNNKTEEKKVSEVEKVEEVEEQDTLLAESVEQVDFPLVVSADKEEVVGNILIGRLTGLATNFVRQEVNGVPLMLLVFVLFAVLLVFVVKFWKKRSKVNKKLMNGKLMNVEIKDKEKIKDK